jgi:hypothetical protein
MGDALIHIVEMNIHRLPCRNGDGAFIEGDIFCLKIDIYCIT